MSIYWHHRAVTLFSKGSSSEEIAEATGQPLHVVEAWIARRLSPKEELARAYDERTPLQRLAAEGPTPAYLAARAQVEARSS